MFVIPRSLHLFLSLRNKTGETRKGVFGVTGNERNGGWGGEGKATFLFTLPVPFDSFQVKLVQHGG